MSIFLPPAPIIQPNGSTLYYYRGYLFEAQKGAPLEALIRVQKEIDHKIDHKINTHAHPIR